MPCFYKGDMMDSEKSKPGDIVHSANAAEICKSAGIVMAKLAWDLVNTDAIYGETFAEETAERLATLSELLYVLFNKEAEILRTLEVPFPEGVTAVVAVNPLKRHSMDAHQPND